MKSLQACSEWILFLFINTCLTLKERIACFEAIVYPFVFLDLLAFFHGQLYGVFPDRDCDMDAYFSL